MKKEVLSLKKDNYNDRSEEELLRAYRNGDLVPVNIGGYWSEAEKKALRAMFENGVGISSIALNFQRSENSIVQQLMAQGMFTAPGARRSRHPKAPQCKCPTCSFQDICQQKCQASQEDK
jgi:hypothetical protein